MATREVCAVTEMALKTLGLPRREAAQEQMAPQFIAISPESLARARERIQERGEMLALQNGVEAG